MRLFVRTPGRSLTALNPSKLFRLERKQRPGLLTELRIRRPPAILRAECSEPYSNNRGTLLTTPLFLRNRNRGDCIGWTNPRCFTRLAGAHSVAFLGTLLLETSSLVTKTKQPEKA